MYNYKICFLKQKASLTILLIMFVMILPVNTLFSQNNSIRNKPIKVNEFKNSNQNKPVENLNKPEPAKDKPVPLIKQDIPLAQTPEETFTAEELEIMNQMEKLKKEDLSSNGNEILNLQKRLENINGRTITRQESNPIGNIIPGANFNPSVTENLNSSVVIGDAGNYIGGIATQVEQRGTTAGKIWVALALINGDTGVLAEPDTIALYYSSNNGNSYNLYAKIAFSSHNKNTVDNIDLEIIENTSGTKYLYIVFGYTTNGGYGQSLIGYTIVTVPTLSYFGSTFFPPGYSVNHRYINARVTSDNARYASNPYVTVVITQDSVSGLNQYIVSKVVRILNPYTLNPALTYLPKSIYGVLEGFQDNNTMTDVANFHNGNDSLIFVLSRYPGLLQHVYLYKAYSNTVVYPTFNGVLTPSGDELEVVRIAATGGTNQTKMLITYSNNYLNTGDFDQWDLYTLDGNNWASNVLDFTGSNISRYGDVIGRRNASGSFNVAFKNIYGNMENVSSYSFRDFSLSSSLFSLNTDYANTVAAPKPAFRYVNNDSCLNIWSYYYYTYSTGGCSVSNSYVRVATEGFYDENADQQYIYSPTYIVLANQNPPYNGLDTGFAYLDYQGMSNVFAFPKALSGDFYFVSKHYNCIETWSSVPVNVDPTYVTGYDFTTSSSQAYGDNMMEKGFRWCVYSGDVNQDGTIDLSDLEQIDNDVYNFIFGIYYNSDLNGDYFVDIADYTIADNNAFNFVSMVRP